MARRGEEDGPTTTTTSSGGPGPPGGRGGRAGGRRAAGMGGAAPPRRAGGARARPPPRGGPRGGAPLLLLALALLAAGGGQARAGAFCKKVRPTECAVEYTDAAGNPSFTEMQETCPGKVCAAVKPQAEAYKYTLAGGEEVDVGGWFCSGASIDYVARVDESSTQPPGKREDDYARCIYSTFDFALEVGGCAANTRPPWDCDHCRAAYKDWICAQVFPKCQGEAPNPTQIVKPCRDLCFKTVRRCPAHLRLDCPDTDPRVYGDPPNCNAAGAELEDLEQMLFHFKNQY